MTSQRRPNPVHPLAPYGLRGWIALVLLLVVPIPAEADTPFGKGVLWRVERAGAAPSHVFGTIHLTDPRVTALPAQVTTAFDGSRKLAIEIVPADDMAERMQRAMILANGRSLDDVLGSELFLRFLVVAESYGIPEAALRRLKPWAAMTVIAVPREEQERRVSGQLALDLILEARARQRGMPVVGLEKLDEQLAIFDGFPEADQVALLRQVVDTHGEITTLSSEMVAYYLKRDIGGLLDWMARRSAGDDPRLRRAFEERLLIQRNRTMRARAEPLLAEGGVFIAVGAAHLPGGKGLLSLLSGRGYRVTRVY
jgi:uncharacterized protein YbaP (TraB family)